jgi:hypothetical protein
MPMNLAGCICLRPFCLKPFAAARANVQRRRAQQVIERAPDARGVQPLPAHFASGISSMAFRDSPPRCGEESSARFTIERPASRAAFPPGASRVVERKVTRFDGYFDDVDGVRSLRSARHAFSERLILPGMKTCARRLAIMARFTTRDAGFLNDTTSSPPTGSIMAAAQC